MYLVVFWGGPAGAWRRRLFTVGEPEAGRQAEGDKFMYVNDCDFSARESLQIYLQSPENLTDFR